MRDFLPRYAERIRYVEQVSRELAQLYGYEEVITPVMERYELLAAKSGEEIRERMYASRTWVVGGWLYGQSSPLL